MQYLDRSKLVALNFQWQELSLTLKGWRNGFGKRLFFCDGRRSDRKEMNLEARWRDQRRCCITRKDR
jgi:hypothetical protein